MYAISLYFMFYNFCKIHKALRVTPAMEAGISKMLWEISDICREVKLTTQALKRLQIISCKGFQRWPVHVNGGQPNQNISNLYTTNSLK